MYSQDTPLKCTLSKLLTLRTRNTNQERIKEKQNDFHRLILNNAITAVFMRDSLECVKFNLVYID